MRKIKVFNILIIIAMIIIDLYDIVVEFNDIAINRLLGQLSLFIILLIPWLLNKLFKIKLSISMHLVFNIFIFFSFTLGVTIDLYNITSWYDKATHGLSGVVSSLFAVLLLAKFTNISKKSILFDIIFIFSFSMLIASCWEFFEFSTDRIMGLNLQHIIETGINDTMWDMISAFIGSIIFSIYYVTFLNKRKIFGKLMGD